MPHDKLTFVRAAFAGDVESLINIDLDPNTTVALRDPLILNTVHDKIYHKV